MKTLNKLAIACGGTGGHFFPGLSIAVELMQSGGNPLLILSGKHSEEQKIKALELNVNSEIIPSPPTPTGILEKIDFSKVCAFNIMKIIKIFSTFKPDAILLMGSYTSIAAGIAATMMQIPIFIHDGNALVGKANLFLSRFANKMALSFPAVNNRKIACKFEITGMPLRKEIIQNKDLPKNKAIEELNKIFKTNLSESLPTILIFGGSQGAAKINDLMPEVCKMQKNYKFQILHIAGQNNVSDTIEKYSSFNQPKIIIGSTDKIHLFYSAADIVVCRSGGSSIAELALYGKFAILAPYPYASDNHQRDNAEYYASTGAGIILSDAEFTITRLSSIIKSFLENPSSYIEKGKEAAKIAIPDASAKVLDMIKSSINFR